MKTTANDATTSNNPDRLLSLDEAAEYLGLADGRKNPGECVRWLCRKRRIKFAKIGKRIRIRRQWLEAYIERQAVAPVGW